MAFFKMIEKERKEFFEGNHNYAFRHSALRKSILIAEAYRLYNCLDSKTRMKAEDRGEIVKHWLEYDEYYDHHPKKPLVTLDDARISVMRIDDGRIGSDTWDSEGSRHPVWHTPINIFSGLI